MFFVVLVFVVSVHFVVCVLAIFVAVIPSLHHLDIRFDIMIYKLDAIST